MVVEKIIVCQRRNSQYCQLYPLGILTLHSDFSISQILREINFGDSKTAKSAILTLLEALNFDFYVFWNLLKA